MLSVSELKKSNLVVNRFFDTVVEDVITKDSEYYEEREEVVVSVKPRLDIFVRGNEGNNVACFSVELNGFNLNLGTDPTVDDWEVCADDMCEKFVYIEHGKAPEVYDDYKAFNVMKEYESFFYDFIWGYGDEYEKGYFKRMGGGEEYCCMTKSAIMQAVLKETDKEKLRILNTVLYCNC